MIMSKAEGVAPPPSAALFAVWEHLERKCKAANSAFMRCKKEKRDPSLCLAEGQAVMDCSYSLISDLHRKAPAEFDEYAYCLWYNSNKLTKCRKEEKAFKEKCKPADAGPDPRAVVAAASPRE